tara:strand:- start:548 stop:985 length:438 start_codon:yes stop_codon:yes gene_type:complete
MKNVKFAALALFTTAAVSAQDLSVDQIPTDLSNNFQKAYPNASDVEWEKEGMNFKVEFDNEKMENEIWYSTEGTMVKSEMEIDENDLPSAISEMIKSKYPEYNVDEVDLINEDGKKMYEIELEKWFSDDVKLLLTENGELVKKTE